MEQQVECSTLNPTARGDLNERPRHSSSFGLFDMTWLIEKVRPITCLFLTLCQTFRLVMEQSSTWPRGHGQEMQLGQEQHPLRLDSGTGLSFTWASFTPLSARHPNQHKVALLALITRVVFLSIPTFKERVKTFSSTFEFQTGQLRSAGRQRKKKRTFTCRDAFCCRGLTNNRKEPASGWCRVTLLQGSVHYRNASNETSWNKRK